MALMDLLPSRKREVEAPPPPPAHKGLLFIGGGRDRIWDTADPESIAVAKRAFDTAIMSGYVGLAYKPTKSPYGGSSMDGEVTRTFDPEADQIRMSLPYAGG